MTLRGIFSELEYGLNGPMDKVERIIDLGANCGFASAYFSTAYPSAQIVAVEPDPANLVQLAKTVTWNKLPVTMVSAAVSSGGRPVFFDAKSDQSTQSRIGDGPTNLAVGSLSLTDIFDLAGWDSIDLLKVDIEGAEKELFNDRSGASLEKVRRILFELHGWVDRDNVISALESRGFIVRISNDIREQVYLAERSTLCDHEV